MLEDVLYEILPVIGVATVLSSIFVLVVMRKAKGNPRVFILFAISDLISGIGCIACGLYGVFQTLNGYGVELLHPTSCLYRAPHLALWAYSDTAEVLVVCLFLLDRAIQICFPKTYGPVAKVLFSKKFAICLFIVASSGFVPAFAETFAANATVRVMQLCRFEEVVYEDFYSIRLLVIEWLPVAGMVWITCIFLIYLVRQSNQAWRYNWTEDTVDTKQMLAIAFIRALSAEAAVRLILINIDLAQNTGELLQLRDFLLRCSISLLVAVLAPCIYILISTPFAEHVGNTFNAYGKNTERKWQSADDPPNVNAPDETQFGSWYSTTGNIRGWSRAYDNRKNIRGEAGVPMEERAEKEKSASFYFDSPPLSESKRPCPPAMGHKSENLRFDKHGYPRQVASIDF